MVKTLSSFIFLLMSISMVGQSTYQIALLKYGGGGDWYANLETSLPNLIEFTNTNLKTNINSDQAIVEIGSEDLFKYPFVHMTGHGNVLFTNFEIENLRNYLISGGFLHIDDNYGMDKFVRIQMKKVFPDLDFVELPYVHEIYHQKFDFNNGLPKIHEHDNLPPKGYGIVYKGRLVCFYSAECDLGDGWEDVSIHNDSQQNRLNALKMGANILQYSFLGTQIN
jgi:hypothetical protein